MTAALHRRLLALEQRRAPTAAWLDMVVLHEGDQMTAQQLSLCARAERDNLPTLTITIARNPHEHA